jgi:hypothetical protein
VNPHDDTVAVNIPCVAGGCAKQGYGDDLCNAGNDDWTCCATCPKFISQDEHYMSSGDPCLAKYGQNTNIVDWAEGGYTNEYVKGGICCNPTEQQVQQNICDRSQGEGNTYAVNTTQCTAFGCDRKLRKMFNVGKDHHFVDYCSAGNKNWSCCGKNTHKNHPTGDWREYITKHKYNGKVVDWS